MESGAWWSKELKVVIKGVQGIATPGEGRTTKILAEI